MAFKLVTFDLDNTLWDTYEVLSAAQKAMHTWIAEHYPRYFDLTEEDHQEFHRHVLKTQPEVRHDLSRFRIAVLQHSFSKCGCGQEQSIQLANRAFQVFYDRRQRVEPFPDAIPLLERLATGFVLASITNGNADVAVTPLGKYFTHQVTAAQVGAMKPAPEPFLRAIELAGVQPHEAVHVGDSLEDDVEGALAVGMQVIWLNWNQADLQASSYLSVRDLSEVESALAGLAERSATH